MARGKAHNAHTKAACMAALLAGQSVDAVAREYAIPLKTVSEWKRHLGTAAELVRTEKTARLGDLLGDYLREALTTLAVQAEFFRTTDWLTKQDAADAAVLHGVITDKAVRLLEALDPGDGSSDPIVPDIPDRGVAAD